MMTSSYSLHFNTMMKPREFDTMLATFDRQSSPPELLHDSEEDDGDSLSTLPLFQHDFFAENHHHHRRKSIPHRSPSMIQDVFQASALDKSIVFQWDKDQSSMQTKVICGESLISALRSKVAMARQPIIKKRVIIHRPRRQLTATCIELPTHNQHHSITQHKLSNFTPVSVPSSSIPSDPPVVPLQIVPETTTTTTTTATTSTQTKTIRHTSSGRPSRVKGPCQACQETSDGCMRKAFNWPFPASQIFNDKGKPFVYLCNKCGLRYNKSGGSVCRHCRWVFCKEEKRKAMQYIDKMRKNRPNRQLDLDEDVEGFVCSPKYWSCGRPWKVGWVLNDDHPQHSDHDEDEDDNHSLM